MKITVKRIDTAAEMESAHKIRKEVFVEEQGISMREEIDTFEDEATHILACIDGVPVGTARWRMTDSGLKLERFAVLPDHRELGVGKALLKYSLQANDTNQRVYLNAQLDVIDFYKRYGFHVVGPQFLEAGILHQKMVKK